MEKEVGGLKSVSSVLSVEVLMGRGGDINWRRIPICICVLGVRSRSATVDGKSHIFIEFRSSKEKALRLVIVVDSQ